MNLHSEKRLRELEIGAEDSSISMFDDSMSIDTLKKGQELNKIGIQKLKNLTDVFKNGIIDFVMYEAIIHEYLPSNKISLPKELEKELTKNVFEPDLAQSQTVSEPSDLVLKNFILKIKILLGTHGSSGNKNRPIIEEILKNGITTDEQKNEMSLLNGEANKYWRILLAEDKRYEEKVNSINMNYYQKKVDLDLKRADDNRKAGKFYASYTQEIDKPKLLKQNVKDLTFQDYSSILSKFGLSESKKLTLKQYLQKKLTISSKEAQLIEATIKSYVKKKKESSPPIRKI
jgi:hypothetical protein